jgi:hypothetical protein
MVWNARVSWKPPARTATLRGLRVVMTPTTRPSQCTSKAPAQRKRRNGTQLCALQRSPQKGRVYCLTYSRLRLIGLITSASGGARAATSCWMELASAMSPSPNLAVLSACSFAA